MYSINGKCFHNLLLFPIYFIQSTFFTLCFFNCSGRTVSKKYHVTWITAWVAARGMCSICLSIKNRKSINYSMCACLQQAQKSSKAEPQYAMQKSVSLYFHLSQRLRQNEQSKRGARRTTQLLLQSLGRAPNACLVTVMDSITINI